MPDGGVDLNNRHPLRLNVGFLLHQGVGTHRSFDFDHARVRLAADLTVSDLHGSIRMSRTAQGLYADGRLQAHATAECVRCLEAFEQPLEIEVHDLFIYPPSQATDPLLTIPETGILDLNPLLREYLLLDLPLRPLCRPDCKGLCPVCGKDLNQGPCDHAPAEIDPRLSVLKTLLSGPEDGSRLA
ncbi:MAG: DUF177 domain-containing protein [Chloroflexota bacterium]